MCSKEHLSFWVEIYLEGKSPQFIFKHWISATMLSWWKRRNHRWCGIHDVL